MQARQSGWHQPSPVRDCRWRGRAAFFSEQVVVLISSNDKGGRRQLVSRGGKETGERRASDGAGSFSSSPTSGSISSSCSSASSFSSSSKSSNSLPTDECDEGWDCAPRLTGCLVDDVACGTFGPELVLWTAPPPARECQRCGQFKFLFATNKLGQSARVQSLEAAFD